ncbi:hypothetical protein [Paenibacillus wenxiniae]|uniref:Uncharacterized protein n=1 Tax=Paenibacillus wenxiniae TaxID=1636843 RepID=A0ABW4REC8_9BACL
MLTLLTALINLAVAAMTLYGKIMYSYSRKKKVSKRRKRSKTQS